MLELEVLIRELLAVDGLAAFLMDEHHAHMGTEAFIFLIRVAPRA